MSRLLFQGPITDFIDFYSLYLPQRDLPTRLDPNYQTYPSPLAHPSSFSIYPPAMKVLGSVKYYLNLFHLSLIYQVKDFFQTSTLHGIRYISESDRPFAERFMWFLFTATGMVSALVIIASLWEKFQTNPTITGLDTNFQTTKMVFPTVLICPLEAFDDQAVTDVAFNHLSGGDSDTSPEYEELLRQMMSLSVKNLEEFYATVRNITSTQEESPNISTVKLRDLMFLVAVKCRDVFQICNFKETSLDCCEVFQPIFTEMGFCYGVNLKYIYKGEGPADKFLEKNDKMLEIMETDKKWSLLVYPRLTSKIYIHSQLEVPSLEMASPGVTWNTDHSIDILVTLKETITTEDTKQLSAGWVQGGEEKEELSVDSQN